MLTKKPILNIADVELLPLPFPMPEALSSRYGARFAHLGQRLGAQKLGYNLTVLPPGKRAFPMHNHHVNEEMFFVVDGEGELRVGADTFPLKTGDVVACPPGGPETAHQIVNTSSRDLKYLAVSTKVSPEVAEYPESNKFGVLADFGEKTPDGKPKYFRFLGRTAQSLDYFDGEK
jgi:uncharacterized cupin superfamily protein